MLSGSIIIKEEPKSYYQQNNYQIYNEKEKEKFIEEGLKIALDRKLFINSEVRIFFNYPENKPESAKKGIIKEILNTPSVCFNGSTTKEPLLFVCEVESTTYQGQETKYKSQYKLTEVFTPEEWEEYLEKKKKENQHNKNLIDEYENQMPYHFV